MHCHTAHWLWCIATHDWCIVRMTEYSWPRVRFRLWANSMQLTHLNLYCVFLDRSVQCNSKLILWMLYARTTNSQPQTRKFLRATKSRITRRVIRTLLHTADDTVCSVLLLLLCFFLLFISFRNNIERFPCSLNNLNYNVAHFAQNGRKAKRCTACVCLIFPRSDCGRYAFITGCSWCVCMCHSIVCMV